MNKKSLNEAHQGAALRAERIAHVFDSALPLPGTNMRVGLDPIVGLIPGIGDIIGVMASSAIIIDAARIGVPSHVLMRMILNVAVDSILGAVPLLGDLFDFGWKANMRNAKLLRNAHGAIRETESPFRRVMRAAIALAALLLLLVVVLAVALTLTISSLWR